MTKLVFCLQTPICTVSWCSGAMLCFSSEMSITDSLLQKEVWPSCRITGASSFAIPEHGTSHSLESTFCAEQTDCISPRSSVRCAHKISQFHCDREKMPECSRRI